MAAVRPSYQLAILSSDLREKMLYFGLRGEGALFTNLFKCTVQEY
jgi:hypothetical protein